MVPVYAVLVEVETKDGKTVERLLARPSDHGLTMDLTKAQLFHSIQEAEEAARRRGYRNPLPLPFGPYTC